MNFLALRVITSLCTIGDRLSHYNRIYNLSYSTMKLAIFSAADLKSSSLKSISISILNWRWNQIFLRYYVNRTQDKVNKTQTIKNIFQRNLNKILIKLI